jgi:hypothetical protein
MMCPPWPQHRELRLDVPGPGEGNPNRRMPSRPLGTRRLFPKRRRLARHPDGQAAAAGATHRRWPAGLLLVLRRGLTPTSAGGLRRRGGSDLEPAGRCRRATRLRRVACGPARTLSARNRVIAATTSGFKSRRPLPSTTRVRSAIESIVRQRLGESQRMRRVAGAASEGCPAPAGPGPTERGVSWRGRASARCRLGVARE